MTAGPATAGCARRTDTGWTLDGHWPQVGSAALADVLLLPAQTESGESLLFAVPSDVPGLQVQPLTTLDATRRMAQVQCRVMALSLIHI